MPEVRNSCSRLRERGAVVSKFVSNAPLESPFDLCGVNGTAAGPPRDRHGTATPPTPPLPPTPQVQYALMDPLREIMPVGLAALIAGAE